MRTLSKLTQVIALLAVGMLLLAGCGETKTTVQSKSSTTNGAQKRAADAASEDDGDSADHEMGDMDPSEMGDMGDMGDLSDLSNIPGIPSDECIDGEMAMSAVVTASGMAFAGGESNMAEAMATFGAWADGAPDEIAAEMALMAEAYAQFIEALGESESFDPTDPAAATPEVMAALEEAAEVLDTDEFKAAQETVEAWFEENCDPEA